MLVPVFLLLYVTTYVNGKLCDKNQFWSSYLQRCEDCTKCVHPDIVIRPCQGHTDTMCGPLSELNLDWSWLKNPDKSHKNPSNQQKEMLETFKENYRQIRQHEKHVRERQKILQQKLDKNSEVDNDGDDEIEGGDIFVGDKHRIKTGDSDEEIWNKLKKLGRNSNQLHKSLEDKVSDDLTALEKQKDLEDPLTDIKKWRKNIFRMPFDLEHGNINHLHFDNEEAMDLLKSSKKEETTDKYDPNHLKFDENDILIKDFDVTKVEEPLAGVKMEKLVDDSKFQDKFSSTEKFILDWQTIILGLAVSSCLIFFLVAAVYSIQHAKHWKKLRNYFDADVEELQSWITSKGSKTKFPSSGIYKTTTEVVSTDGGQCKYLERIINMNGKKKSNLVAGNVYEIENIQPELKPLTGKFPIVHKHKGDRI